MKRQFVLFNLFVRIEVCKKAHMSSPVQAPPLYVRVFPATEPFKVKPLPVPSPPSYDIEERPCKKFWKEGITPGPDTANLWSGKMLQERAAFMREQGNQYHCSETQRRG